MGWYPDVPKDQQHILVHTIAPASDEQSSGHTNFQKNLPLPVQFPFAHSLLQYQSFLIAKNDNL
jgi:hypothetical protein